MLHKTETERVFIMRFSLFSKFLCHLLSCIGRFRKNANSLHFIFFPSSSQPSHTETFMRTYFTEIGYQYYLSLSLSRSLSKLWMTTMVQNIFRFEVFLRISNYVQRKRDQIKNKHKTFYFVSLYKKWFFQYI